MDLLTAIASSTQVLTAVTAKEALVPIDSFFAFLTDSMTAIKASVPAAIEQDRASTSTPKQPEKPTNSDSQAELSVDMSGQSILAMLTQINAYQAATTSKDSPAASASMATTDIAKPAPPSSTEPSEQALALDKLTFQLKKTGPAETADIASTASVASTPSQALTPTHLTPPFKLVMDAPQTTVPQAIVNTPFGKSGWTQAVAQQVMVMVKDKVQTISLALNPPNLGPLQVVVKIENQVANVQFSSAAPEVQQALRDGLPVLQEMLGQAGVALGQADIGNRQPQRGQKNHSEKQSKSSLNTDEEFIQSIHNASQTDTSQRLGLVNIYA